MAEISDHWAKQFHDKLVPQSGFQLIQVLISIDELLVIIVQRLLDVDLDLFIENLGQRL